ncbi:hypothetical protein TSEDIMI_40010 [Tenacibaculum sediminilitoris]|uniref:cadherin repeat domain-containing protein n=1 Tax=Tenacibaculum sediminilitoris TaxID=1820334 RepID=UPI0038937EC1
MNILNSKLILFFCLLIFISLEVKGQGLFINYITQSSPNLCVPPDAPYGDYGELIFEINYKNDDGGANGGTFEHTVILPIGLEWPLNPLVYWETFNFPYSGSVTRLNSRTISINGPDLRFGAVGGWIRLRCNAVTNVPDPCLYSTNFGVLRNVGIQFAFGSSKQCLKVSDQGIGQCNIRPLITSSSSVKYFENSTEVVLKVEGVDEDLGAVLTSSIVGGVDADVFNIDPYTGEITFKTSPDFEAPTDDDLNNVYHLTVSLCDQGGLCDVQNVEVEVLNVLEKDTDGDGVEDLIDLDDDNDGILDVVEGSNDFDEDGVPNSLDLDSDNDGIYDIVEVGTSYLDANNDGRIDNMDNNTVNLDVDEDGLADSVETINGNDTGTTPRETISGVMDYLSSDSDNDGCSDANEAYKNVNSDGIGNQYYNPNDLIEPLTITNGVDSDGRVIAALYDTGDVEKVIDRDFNSSICNPVFPDFYPTLFTGKTLVIGRSASIDFYIIVGEAKGSDSDESIPVEVRIPDSDRLKMEFVPSLVTINGVDIDNSLWSYKKELGLHKFTYIGNGGVFTGNTFSKIGIKAVFNSPENAKGKLPLKVTVKYDSGGQINIKNDNDEDIIEYNNIGKY